MLSAPVDTMPPYVEPRDEIGAMARSMSMFRSALEERRVRDDEAERYASERRPVISALANALAKLSDGDLAWRITQPFPPGGRGRSL